MRLSLRFSPPVVLGAAILLASVLLPLPQNGVILDLPSPCPFFHLTGLPCAGCGLTRSFVCCGHGQVGAAWGWHPLGPLLFGATLLYVLGSLAGVRFAPRRPNLLLGIGTLVLVAFWVMRLGGIFPMPAA